MARIVAAVAHRHDPQLRAARRALLAIVKTHWERDPSERQLQKPYLLHIPNNGHRPPIGSAKYLETEFILSVH